MTTKNLNLNCPYCNGTNPSLVKMGRDRAILHCEYCESTFVTTDEQTMFLLNYTLELEEKEAEEKTKLAERKANRINTIKDKIKKHTETFEEAEHDKASYDVIIIVLCIFALICCLPCIIAPLCFLIIGAIFTPIIICTICEMKKVYAESEEEEKIINRLKDELARIS